jgi:hypothetical protein
VEIEYQKVRDLHKKSDKKNNKTKKKPCGWRSRSAYDALSQKGAIGHFPRVKESQTSLYDRITFCL